MEMTGARMATRKKKITIAAEMTPVRSRRKRSHMSWPGERPTASGVSGTDVASITGAVDVGVVI